MMKKLHDLRLGTPKTLKEAIGRAACIGPAREGMKKIHDNVIDFLNQRFATAYLKAESESELERLEKLYLLIIQKEEDKHVG